MKPFSNGFVGSSLLVLLAVSLALTGLPAAAQERAQEPSEPEAMDAPSPESGSEPAPEPPSAAEDPRVAVVQADRDLAAAVANGDPEAFAALIAEDAVFLSGADTLRGRDAVVEGWMPLMAEDRAAELIWEPKGVRLAESGDLAYTIGGYELTVRTAEGEPAVSQGQYLSVWELGEDGAWRAAADGPLRRDRAAFLEVALEKQGRLGPGVGAVFEFRPERTVQSSAGDVSYTVGVYAARRVNADGSEESLAEGGWLSVWALDPEKSETALLPGGDAVTQPAAPAPEE